MNELKAASKELLYIRVECRIFFYQTEQVN